MGHRRPTGEKAEGGRHVYEPAMCRHRISHNPDKTATRLLVVMLHPKDAKEPSSRSRSDLRAEAGRLRIEPAMGTRSSGPPQMSWAAGRKSPGRAWFFNIEIEYARMRLRRHHETAFGGAHETPGEDVFITGGNSGIGPAMARLFVTEGAGW